MRQLKCFIASAFDKKDVDNIFFKVIRPVLTIKRINPLRVDRLEHNDDIDDKILELIDECDFCIADLTYARPSVYYEAGRVHGLRKSVIFIARSDHFNPRVDDEYGNFKVHFDLQMKNIISWKKPTDTFQKRLSSRIDHVIKPILQKIEREETTQHEEETFNRLSQVQKFENLRHQAASQLPKTFRISEEKRIFLNGKYVSGLTAIRTSAEKTDRVRFLFNPSFTKKELEMLHTSMFFSWGDSHEKKIDRSLDDIVHIICCSLRPVPINRIEEALPFYTICEPKVTFIHVQNGWGKKKKMHVMHVHIIDGIKSLHDFEKRLKEHLVTIRKG
ncbi:MAG TPA: hypothetical protein VFG29_08545 [Syntrophales bacterium]|nr:hypothetical protein [Syntrophales bacterium]